ncbi:hypothetical protein GE09DRAFT_1078795 [Coniochaeta sp. 2T2.1]|nr:hypothetical protein GE09DRAFT_1078795 [Coniochaeta sp. 2T2.1]
MFINLESPLRFPSRKRAPPLLRSLPTSQVHHSCCQFSSLDLSQPQVVTFVQLLHTGNHCLRLHLDLLRTAIVARRNYKGTTSRLRYRTPNSHIFRNNRTPPTPPQLLTMFTTRILRQAAQHAERTPSIKFLGKRTVPSSVDHTSHPHPASPTQSLPKDWASGSQSTAHNSFSSYRDHAQQFGPLRKTIKSGDAGIGGNSGAELGPIKPPQGYAFDRNELPARFRRVPLTMAEIEVIESGGAAAFA